VGRDGFAWALVAGAALRREEGRAFGRGGAPAARLLYGTAEAVPLSKTTWPLRHESRVIPIGGGAVGEDRGRVVAVWVRWVRRERREAAERVRLRRGCFYSKAEALAYLRSKGKGSGGEGGRAVPS
jgi:hypothetical protein